MANNKCTIGLSWWDSRILGFWEFGFRDLSSLTLDTALTISSLVNDSRPNNIFGAFRLFAISMNFFRASCVRFYHYVWYWFVHPLFSWGGLFHNAAWLRMLCICVLSIIPTTSYPSKVVTHFVRYPAPCFVWMVTNSIFITLEPVWFLTFDLNFTYCLYWSICCSLSLSVLVLDIHIGCLVYLRITIMWHATMTVNRG